MKNKLMLAVIMAVSFLSCLGSVTEQQALQAVLNSIPQARRTNSRFYIGELSASTWMIFEDMMPGADWQHDAMIHSVDKNASSSNPVITSSSTNQIPEVYLWEVGDASQRPAFAPANQITSVTVPKRNVPEDGKQYAVILSGGVNPANNHARYWNNCSYMYRVLRNHFNVPASNIFVAFSNGDVDEPDMSGNYRSSRDLDGDGVSDVYCPATLAGVRSLFRKLATTLTPEDHLFVFVTDHGAPATDNRGTSICLWGSGSYLYASNFRSLIDNIDCASKNIVMAQCYSGGFAEAMEGAENVVIATASSKEEVNWSTAYYAPFLKRWIDSLWSNTEEADTDGDGIVSVREAFAYTSGKFLNDIRPYVQHPQFYTCHDNLADNLSFEYLPDYCNLTIADHSEDGGSLNLNNRWWNSPEIVTRGTSLDTSMVPSNPAWSPTTKRTNYVNVRVKNRGWRTF